MHYLYRDLLVLVGISLYLSHRHILRIFKVDDLALLLIFIVLHDRSRFDVSIQRVIVPSFGLLLHANRTLHDLAPHLIVIVLYLFHLLAHGLVEFLVDQAHSHQLCLLLLVDLGEVLSIKELQASNQVLQVSPPRFILLLQFLI